jgi:MSHA pilin protein MshA
MKRTVSGFTLIELVVVITLIGILAAVALPRYINLQADARAAKAQAIYGAVKSAGLLAKARCEVDLAQLTPGGTCTSAAGTANMDGVSVAMVNRYPAATATGIDAAAQISASEGVTVGGAVGTRTYDVVGATTAASCRVSYAEAGVAAAPVVSVATAGC